MNFMGILKFPEKFGTFDYHKNWNLEFLPFVVFVLNLSAYLEPVGVDY